MDWSTPGFPVLYHLLEIAQTRVYRVGDAIQPSHPLSSPTPPAFNISWHQGLFWVSSSHQLAKVLELQLQHLNLARKQLLGSLKPPQPASLPAHQPPTRLFIQEPQGPTHPLWGHPGGIQNSKTGTVTFQLTVHTIKALMTQFSVVKKSCVLVKEERPISSVPIGLVAFWEKRISQSLTIIQTGAAEPERSLYHVRVTENRPYG